MKTMNIGNGRAVLMDDDIHEKIKKRGGSLYQGSVLHTNYIYIFWNKQKSEGLARFILELTTEDNRIAYFKDGDIFNCTRDNLYAATKTKMYQDRGPTAGRKYKGLSQRGDKHLITLPFGKSIYNTKPFDNEDIAAGQYDAILDFINRPGYRNFSDKKIDILPERKEHIVAWLKKHNIEVNYNE